MHRYKYMYSAIGIVLRSCVSSISGRTSAKWQKKDNKKYLDLEQEQYIK